MKKTALCGVSIFVCIVLYVQTYAAKGDDMSSLNNDTVLIAEVINQEIKKEPDKDAYRLILPMRFSLRNNGEKSVIVIKRAVQVIGFRMATTQANLEKKIYVDDSLTLPSFIQKDLLNLKFPTQDLVQLISPKESYDWTVDYWLTLSEKTPNGFRSAISSERLRCFNSLWVEFDVAFFPMNSMAEVGSDLSAKWKDNGNLLLDTLTTNPIEIVLPQTLK